MQTSYDKENVVYAGFFSRLAAFVLDSILVGIGLWLVKVPVWFIKLSAGDSVLFRPFLFQYTIFDVIYYLLTVAYFVLTTYYCGATLGKYLMKLKVVDVEGQKLGFMTVLIRETVGRYLSALIIYIGYLLIGMDNRKQGLHDRIADTFVVYREKRVERPVQRVSEEVSNPVVSIPQEEAAQQVPEASLEHFEQGYEVEMSGGENMDEDISAEKQTATEEVMDEVD